MKKIILTGIVILYGISAFAQWTSGTGVIFPTTLTDKVGIGHNTPASLLHILGTTEQLRLGNSTTNYISFTTNSNGALTLTRNGTSASTKSVAFAGGNGDLAVISNNSGSPVLYVRGNSTGDLVNVLDGTTNVFSIKDGGNVGVGISAPSDKFHVAGGGIKLSNTGSTGFRLFNSADDTEKMHLYWRPSDDVIELNAGAGSGRKISFVTGGIEGIRINSSGNVGIGTSNPDEKLAVNGKIHAKEVKIDLNVPAPDYVFEKDYPLMELDELKAYLEKNHHLPDVPPAEQMEKEGVNISDLNMRMLKKIEELTLYLLQKDEQIKQQKERLRKLEAVLLKEGKN